MGQNSASSYLAGLGPEVNEFVLVPPFQSRLPSQVGKIMTDANRAVVASSGPRVLTLGYVPHSHHLHHQTLANLSRIQQQLPWIGLGARGCGFVRASPYPRVRFSFSLSALSDTG